MSKHVDKVLKKSMENKEELKNQTPLQKEFQKPFG